MMKAANRILIAKTPTVKL
jgi:hypothetical protein